MGLKYQGHAWPLRMALLPFHPQHPHSCQMPTCLWAAWNCCRKYSLPPRSPLGQPLQQVEKAMPFTLWSQEALWFWWGILRAPYLLISFPLPQFRSDSFTLKTQSLFAVAEISVYVALGIRDWFHGSSNLLQVMKLCLIVGQLLTCALVVPELYW